MDTHETARPVAINKAYNKGTNIPIYSPFVRPHGLNAYTTGIIAEDVGTMLRTTTQVALTYSQKLGIDTKQRVKIQ